MYRAACAVSCDPRGGSALTYSLNGEHALSQAFQLGRLEAEGTGVGDPCEQLRLAELLVGCGQSVQRVEDLGGDLLG
ncbi:hypothetical protein [Streptomyces sp. NPDC021356]|uniref:hypothetical protein n=1 Tax=Streptomyces sp. NPDC021356 TaxID=3154900 RepID=UPI0033C8A8BD